MRPVPFIHTAALPAILSLETRLLWQLNWSPYSTSDILTPILTTPFQHLHTRFALVRFHRQNNRAVATGEDALPSPGNRH